MATQYANGKIVTDGLVLCLNAADKNSYPGSGTTWTDISGNGYNGTLTNGPTFNSGNGGAIVFDGTDDYSIGNTTLNINTNLTINAFIYPTSYPSGGGGGGFIVSNIGYYLELKNTGVLRSYFYGLSSPGYHDGLTTIDLNKWSYVTLIRDGSANTITTYINTVLDRNITGITGNINNGIQNYQVGGYQGGSYSYVGRIASVQIYNRTLNIPEITQNYNAQKSRFGL